LRHACCDEFDEVATGCQLAGCARAAPGVPDAPADFSRIVCCPDSPWVLDQSEDYSWTAQILLPRQGSHLRPVTSSCSYVRSVTGFCRDRSRVGSRRGLGLVRQRAICEEEHASRRSGCVTDRASRQVSVVMTELSVTVAPTPSTARRSPTTGTPGPAVDVSEPITDSDDCVKTCSTKGFRPTNA
jgi:hypothetical protein